MNGKFEGDPLEELRRSDPLDPRDVPEDASGPHARALFERIVATDPTASPARVPPRRVPRLVPALAGAAVIVAAVVGLTVLRGDSGGEKIVGGVPIASPAMCVETYDLETLTRRDVAFDGTLASIDGEQVTFSVGRWFRGGPGDDVVLDATGLVGGLTPTSAGGATLDVGGRYLVSGSGGSLWACGFTMTYDTEIADRWADVLGS